ncbi:response regulator [Flaviaesturariibacter amylovorans]|uniref:Response regulator n=1 Tax=Flaviaesturariibacter amylovorans TaxID=1084520 RepID=A0ABP8G4F1_9BACT
MPLLINKILLVDDDPDDGFLMEKALLDVSPDLQLRYLEESDHLLALLAAEVPDLIFMDINMPRCNGMDALAELKRSAYAHVPVVMYSSSDRISSVTAAYEQGATLYFRKPASFGSLVDALRVLIGYDWSNPDAVKASQLLGGQYLPFETPDVR